MFDNIKNSLGTTAGWLAAITFMSNGVQYFTPDYIDTQVQSITGAVCTAVIALSSIYHFYLAGKIEK